MLNKDENNAPIQAFPIHSQTFIGVADNEPCTRRVVHVAEPCTVTFFFPGGVQKVFVVNDPTDFSVSHDCTGVTSDGEVWIG